MGGHRADDSGNGPRRSQRRLAAVVGGAGTLRQVGMELTPEDGVASEEDCKGRPGLAGGGVGPPHPPPRLEGAMHSHRIQTSDAYDHLYMQNLKHLKHGNVVQNDINNGNK